MKSSDILLSLDGKRLETFKTEGLVYVSYKDCDIKDGCSFRIEHGIGSDFESACDDYLSKIRGKHLVFNHLSFEREDIIFNIG